MLCCRNLTGNNLEGSLPDGLIQKAKNGSLSLRFTLIINPLGEGGVYIEDKVKSTAPITLQSVKAV